MSDTIVVKKSNKLGGKIWTSIILFGFMGQLAWMVENMYFSTYIQKNITTDGWATSATVAASAVVAALVTILGGALTDRLGKRKVFVCWGYIIWGIVTASFAFFGNNHVTEDDVVKVVIIFVIMDCVMTVFGSMANDAAFSSWITDVTDITNRGFVEIILSIMPVAALLVIFVGFNGLTDAHRWDLFFIILGLLPAIVGVIGLFIFKDSPSLKPDKSGKYMAEVIYGFKPSTIKKNKMIYICLIGMMFSGLAMQMWQPYMIMLLQYTLGFGDGFVIPLAAVVLLSAAVAVAGGKIMDKYGKDKMFYPVAAAGVVGGLLVYFIKFTSGNAIATYVMFILGGTLIEGASLLMAGLFNASARDYTPSDKAGCFQGIRIVIYVTLPMIIASIVLPFIIDGFGPVVEKYNVAPAPGYFPIPEILDSYGQIVTYEIGKHVYPYELFLFSAIAAAFVFVPAVIVKRENKKFRAEKLAEIHAIDTAADSAEAIANTDVVEDVNRSANADGAAANAEVAENENISDGTEETETQPSEDKTE
ncbi:MAG: MFS transporter [Corallococcus sp.]|nr:MFS transporter [Corallococcus sp.]